MRYQGESKGWEMWTCWTITARHKRDKNHWNNGLEQGKQKFILIGILKNCKVTIQAYTVTNCETVTSLICTNYEVWCYTGPICYH